MNGIFSCGPLSLYSYYTANDGLCKHFSCQGNVKGDITVSRLDTNRLFFLNSSSADESNLGRGAFAHYARMQVNNASATR